MAHSDFSNPNQSDTHETLAGTANAKTRKRSARHDPPATFEQLLRVAYERKGRRLTLPAKQHKVVAQNLDISDEFRDVLQSLKSEDLLFAVPRELLLLSSDPRMNTKLRSALQEVVRNALLAQPLLSAPELQDAVRNTGDGPEPDAAIACIMHVEQTAVDDQATKKLTNAAFGRLRLNVAHTLALSISQARSIGTDALANILFRAIWKDAADRVRPASKRLRVLTDTTQLKGMATSSSVFQQAADQAREQVGVLTTRVSRISQSIAVSQRENAALHQQLDEQNLSHANAQAAAAAQVSELTNRADNQAIHLREDREILRTRVLRALKSDLDLLQSGLDAAHRPVPKPGVLVDAAERVTDSLRRQLRQLEEG